MFDIADVITASFSLHQTLQDVSSSVPASSTAQPVKKLFLIFNYFFLRPRISMLIYSKNQNIKDWSTGAIRAPPFFLNTCKLVGRNFKFHKCRNKSSNIIDENNSEVLV